MRYDFPNRLDDPEETQESAEFLPSADGKKTTRFTDVWTHVTHKGDDEDDDMRFADHMKFFPSVWRKNLFRHVSV